MSRKFSYEVLVQASPKLAWEIFSNWRRWHTFSNIYGRLEWTSGEPWTVGSRLSIEVLRPIHVTIEHVITHCDPAEKVGWIDHALGVAIDQWVTFAAKNGGTLVRVVGEIVGTPLVFTGGVSLETFIGDFTRNWYDAFRDVCDQLALSA